MRVSPLLRFVFLALWLCAGAATAQDDALYEGESMVDSQSEEQRAAALPRALGQVLVKVTGDPSAASDPAFQGALGRAAGMVQQYRYREDVVTQGGVPRLRSFLIARFNPQSVDALIVGAGRRIWPAPRPRPLLWLAIDDGRGPRLVGEAQQSAVASLIRRAAERGLQIAFPLADVQDQTLGGPQSVWNGDTAAVRDAAMRYGGAPVLIGKLRRGGSGWLADWVLIDGGTELHRWNGSNANAGAVLAGGADGFGLGAGFLFRQAHPHRSCRRLRGDARGPRTRRGLRPRPGLSQAHADRAQRAAAAGRRRHPAREAGAEQRRRRFDAAGGGRRRAARARRAGRRPAGVPVGAMIGRHLPNALTALRLATVPWVAWLLRERELSTAAAVVSAAALTDALDGWLARRFGWQSWLGGWLDPIADKVLVAAAYVGLALIEPDFAPLALIVVLRDVVIVAGASAYRALVGPLAAHPTWLGKFTSPVQLAFVVWMLLRVRQLGGLPPEWAAGCFAVGALTLASGAEYVLEWSRRARRNWPGRGKP